MSGTGSCGTGSGSGNTATLANIALNTGSTATITFTTTPTTVGTASATSSVTVPSGWTDSASGNNTANVSTTLSTPTTDLSAVNNTAASYTTGSSTTITMSMSNTGTNIASGAGWTAALPGNFASTSWTCAITAGTGSCGTASGSGNTATLANVALNTGATATITFTTTPTTAGTASATSSVTVPSGWTDSSSGNNSSNVSTTLSAPSTDIVYISTSTNNGTNVSSLLMPAAASATTNDMLIAIVNQSSDNSTTPVFSAPSGWTQLGTTRYTTNAAYRVHQAVFWKRWASATDDTPTFSSNSTAGRMLANVLVYRNVGGNPIPPIAPGYDFDGTCAANANYTGYMQSGGTTPWCGGVASTTRHVLSKADNTPVARMMAVTTAILGDGVGASAIGWTGGVLTPTQRITYRDLIAGSSYGIRFSAAEALLPNAGDNQGDTRFTITYSAAYGNNYAGIAQAVILCPLSGCGAPSTSTDLSTANNTAATYTTGSATTITMTMSNSGTNIASGAGWTAVLPSNFASTTWTCAVSGTGSCGTGSGSGNTVTLANVSLNTGSTATITFTTTPTTAGTASATSSVTVPSGWTDSSSGNNTSNVSTTVSAPSSTDLSIVTSGVQAWYMKGTTPVTWTTTITNNGPAAVTGASATLTFGGCFNSGSGSPVPTWSCSVNGGTADCDTTTAANPVTGSAVSGGQWWITPSNIQLNSGGSITYTVTANATMPTTTAACSTFINSSVAVPSGGTDTNSANNSHNFNTLINSTTPSPDISTANNTATSYTAGATPTITMTMSNPSGWTVGNARWQASLPANFTGTTWTCAVTTGTGQCGTSSGTGNSVDLTNVWLNSAAVATLTFNTTASSTGTGLSSTSVVTVPSGWSDPSTGNNTANVTTAINAAGPAFVCANQATTGASMASTLAITPCTTTVGDFMLAYFSQRTNTMPTHTAPAGWTQVGSTVLRNGQIGSSIWYKTYASGDASGVTFSSTNSGRSSVQIMTYSGIGSAAPVAPSPLSWDSTTCAAGADATGFTQHSGFGSGTCYNATYRSVAKALNATATGGILVGHWIHGWSNTTTDQTWDLTGASGMTQRHQSENDAGVGGLSVVIADSPVSATGSTGDQAAAPSEQNGVVHALGRLVMLCPGSSACGDNGSGTLTDVSTVNNTAAAYTTGSSTTITMTMSNSGTNIASGAGWTAVLPSNFASTTWTCTVSGTGSCGTGSGSGNTVTLANVSLNTGSTATITFTTTPTTAGTASATSSVTVPSGWSDPSSGNNTSNVSTTVSAPSTDLSTVNNTATTYTSGSATTITMTMSNTGTNIASGAGWTAALPSNFASSTTWTCAITSGTGNCGTASGSGNTATLANVALNSGATATITFTTTPTTAGTASATSSVTVPSGWTDSSAGEQHQQRLDDRVGAIHQSLDGEQHRYRLFARHVDDDHDDDVEHRHEHRRVARAGPPRCPRTSPRRLGRAR